MAQKIYAALACDLKEWTPELEHRMTRPSRFFGFKLKPIHLVKVVKYEPKSKKR